MLKLQSYSGKIKNKIIRMKNCILNSKYDQTCISNHGCSGNFKMSKPVLAKQNAMLDRIAHRDHSISLSENNLTTILKV